MIRAALLLLALAACGVDGPPLPPADPAPARPGLSISGTAEVGVSGTR